MCSSSPPYLVVILCACALGCTEHLEVRDEAETPFTIYGVLTPDRDTQSVRVYIPQEFPTLAPTNREHVDVYSTDLSTGHRRIWQDTVLAESDDGSGIIFWAPFRPEFDRTYRVEAVRPDDEARSYADVRIPPRVSFRLNEESAPLLQVLIEGEDVRVLKPEAEYVVRPAPPADGPYTRVKFDYQGLEERTENGWSLTLNTFVDYEEIRFIVRASNFCGEVMVLDSLQIHLLVGDATWDPPGGVFDPVVLSQPDRLSNVVNGFGFVGGGYRMIQPLFPSRQAVESACFIYVW